MGDETEKFINWLKTNGAKISDLYINKITETERNVMSSSRIVKNQTIIKIPKKLIITDKHGRDSYYGKLLLNGNYEKITNLNIALVAIYMLSTFNSNGFFQPYYNILPTNISHFPIFWREKHLSLLKGSNILNDIANRIDDFKNDYKIIGDNCKDFKSKFPLKHFLYIRTLIGSRNFGIYIDGVRRCAMIPLSDMLNHDSNPSTNWYYSDKEEAFKMDTNININKSIEITDTYGNKCNSKYLLYYGFTLQDNKKNTIYIKLRHREDGLNKLKYNISPSFNGYLKHNLENDIITDLMPFLRVSAASKKQLLDYPTIQYYNEPIDKENEFIALDNLKKALNTIEANYTYRFKPLLNKLKTTEKFTREYHAINLIIGEIKIIHFYKEMIEYILNKFKFKTRSDTNKAYELYENTIKSRLFL